MFTKCKDVKRLDPGKDVNKLFKNVLSKWRIQNFFRGDERRANFDIFTGRVTSRKIDKQKQLQEGRGECYPKNFFTV